jgi:hypothetical protein
VNAVLTRALPHALSAPALTAVATVASAAGVLAGPRATAVPGGMLLGFVLPGLALTWLIFRNRTLSAVEKTVLAPGLSLAVLIISGLLLYVAGFPLDRTSWTLAAAGATLAVLALKAVPERVWLGEDEDDAGPAEARTELIPLRKGDPPPIAVHKPVVRPGPFPPWSPKQKVTALRLVRQLTPMVLVVAILAGAGYLSFLSARHSYRVTVTTLSAAPPGPGGASGTRAVDLRASGLVPADGPYTVVVTDPDGVRLIERPVPVPESGTWQAGLSLPAGERLTVSLFRAGDTFAYRTLYLAAEE